MEMTEPLAKKRVLFVCTQNKVRSLTAEHLYRGRPDLEVKSAGTATFAKNQLTEEVMQWADVVFVFDDSQLEVIAKRFGPDALGKMVICLGLADIYTYKSDPLVLKLISKLDPYLGRPNAKKCPRSSPLFAAKLVAPTGAEKSEGRPRSLMANLLSAVGVGGKKGVSSK
jgi:predicted protein tyrosine phosphatase